MAENDAKKKQKMIGSATDHHQKEGDSDDSVNQADPGDSSIMKEDDPKENLKMMSSISYHLQKDGGDDSSRLALKNEGDTSDGDATELMNAIISTPKKRKGSTTTAGTPSKKQKEQRWTGPSKTATALTVKRFHKMNVKVPKKDGGAAVGGAAAAAAAGNDSSDSDASSILFIEGKGCSSPTSGLLPKAPPETDGKN
ncbi:hypothetical protein QL285_066086 [Trifolium repens]|nr:hypothetical protein QL285_066086 [Trifolium repens]